MKLLCLTSAILPRASSILALDGQVQIHDPSTIARCDGKLFLLSAGRFIGPGHFGVLDFGDGVQKFLMHYEPDLDRGGACVLDTVSAPFTPAQLKTQDTFPARLPL